MSLPQLAVAVFARTAVAGQVKTRLISQLGAQGAADLQAQLIDRSFERALAVAPTQTLAWWTGAGELSCDAAVKCVEQMGEDLGERMMHAFAQMLPHAQSVLLIGTDCPAQRVDDLRQAADALKTHDAVFQPAQDGGYVLVGLRNAVLLDDAARWRQLFVGIAWGSDAVYAQTQARLAQTGLSAYALPALPDLDLPQDYEQAVQAGWVEPVNPEGGAGVC